MHILTQRLIRFAAFAVTAIWVVMIGMSTGVATAIFPGSITLDSGHLYIWSSQLSDTFASLTLIFIILVAFRHGQNRPESNILLLGNDVIGNEVGSTLLESAVPVLDVEQSDDLLRVHVARRRLVVATALIVGIVLLSSTFEQVLGGNHFNASFKESAVSLSNNNLTLPALEASLQELPRNFSSTAYQQYYLASRWASAVGASGTAANLDVLLVRASVDLKNPIGLVVGLNRYSMEENHSVSESVREKILSTKQSHPWRIAIEAAFQWQKSGDASKLIGDLESISRASSPSLRQEFLVAIALVRSYDGAA